MNSLIKTGEVLRVTEPDYMYGTGDLILKVTKVGSVQRLRDGEWINLEGLKLRQDGSQVSHEPRQALVRLSALRRHGRTGRSG